MGATKEERALLAQYGLKSEGPVATLLSLGFNRRANARKMAQIKPQEAKRSAELEAAHNAALKQYWKDLNAVHARARNKLSV